MTFEVSRTASACAWTGIQQHFCLACAHFVALFCRCGQHDLSPPRALLLAGIGTWAVCCVCSAFLPQSCSGQSRRSMQPMRCGRMSGAGGRLPRSTLDGKHTATATCIHPHSAAVPRNATDTATVHQGGDLVSASSSTTAAHHYSCPRCHYSRPRWILVCIGTTSPALCLANTPPQHLAVEFWVYR